MHTGSIVARIIAAMDLNQVPWTLLVSAALGVWLMAAPTVLGSTNAAADSDHLMGALVVTWAVIAFGAVARWNDEMAGAAIVALSFRRGAIKERFGSWNHYLA
jgi:hypothetical protein